MACQLSFKTTSYIEVPVYSPVEFSRCNVLVIDNDDTVGNRHDVAVEEQGSDYVFRLWAMGNQSSICSQCGIIQNHHGLEWYTKLTGLRLNVGAVHDVDIALGGLSVFYFRFLFIDFVYPYITDVFAFVSKAPTPIPLTQAIIYPFQQQVWMALFASLLVAWAGVVVLRRWTPREKLVGDAPDIWLLLATLIRQSDWGSEFRTLSFRCLLTAWLILSVVASNSYSCLLLSFMSVPAFSPRVDTSERLQEAILAGKYTAGTSNGTAQYTLIMESSEGPLATVRACMVRYPDRLVPDKQEGLDKAMRENYAYIDTQRGLRAALHDRQATSIEVSTGHVGTTIMSLAMHKTCFYRDAFSTVSRRLVESGHFLKWEREDQPVRPKMKQNHFKAIELSDVFSHGTILIAGYCLALVALASEYARFRYKSRRCVSQDQRWPADNTPKATASSMIRPRRTKKTQQQQQRRQSSKRSSATVAVAVPTPLPPLPPVNRPRRWETRVVGQSGFKRVSINLVPHAFPKIDSAATAGLPLVASGAGGQARRGDRCPLPNLPPVST
ncbi:glutamate receptor-like [Dermacentor andersoni]|uniref:glutamate receptor-like n=1 Tax=Dermacentor andersoni TaxID=34620 RepID=UPI003B3B2FED